MTKRPWIIWVETINSQIFVFVYKPRHSTFLRWFNRWAKVDVVHTDGPIYYDPHSPADESRVVLDAFEAGMSYVPENTRAMTATSLKEVREIVDESFRP